MIKSSWIRQLLNRFQIQQLTQRQRRTGKDRGRRRSFGFVPGSVASVLPHVEPLEDRTLLTTAIDFAANVLTINVGANGEQATLAVSGSTLSVTSSSAGTTATAAAQAIGFAANSGQNVANNGNIGAANDVARIDITGGGGTQTLVIGGGMFPATRVLGSSVEILNVTGNTTVSNISGHDGSYFEADVGESITLTGSVDTTNTNGLVRLVAGSGAIVIGASINAGTGDVILSAGGAISDAAGDDTTLDITADGLIIEDATAVGSSVANAVNVAANSLTINGVTGNVFLSETNGIALGDVNVASNTFDLQVAAGSVTGVGPTVFSTFTPITGPANPMHLKDTGFYSAPAFGDLDGDGDLDLLSGDVNGQFQYFTNTGSSTAAAFTQQTGSNNPLDGDDVGRYSTPAFGDIDGDGDLDLFSGADDGGFHFFENIGNSTTPDFVLRTGGLNPLNGISAGSYSAPSFGDLDNDGDLDLIAGEKDGKFFLFENTGSANSPAFTPRTGVDNPGREASLGKYSTPTLGDLDGDGDLDLIGGNFDGTLKTFENVGDKTQPVFRERSGSANPFNGVDLGRSSRPVVGDIDADGDLDVIAGEYDGVFFSFDGGRQPALSNVIAGDAVINAAGAGAAIGEDSATGVINVTLSGSLTATASSGNGGIYISETGSMSVATVNAGGGDVELTATGPIDEAANNATTKVTGNSVTLTAAGAIGDDADVTNAPLDIDVTSLTAVTSATGEVSLIDAGGLTLTNVSAVNGSVRVQSGGAVVATSITATGDATVIADTGTLTVGAITAGASSTATVTATGGSLLNASSSIAAGDAVLTAGGTNSAIGSSGAANDINVSLGGSLTANAANGVGGVYVTQTGNLLIGTVNADAGTVDLTTSGSIDEAADSAATKVTGAVVMLSAGGRVGNSANTVTSPLDIAAGTLTVTTSATGDVSLIDAGGVAVSNITTNSGDVRLASDGAVSIATVLAEFNNVEITSSGGSLTNNSSSITAANLTLNTSHAGGAIGAAGAANDIDVTLSGWLKATAATGSGGVYVTESNATSVKSIDAGTGNVVLVAGGAIDETDDNATVKVAGANVTLTAAGAIGDNADVTNAPLDIQVDSLTSTASAAGEIYVRDTGGLTLTNVSNTDGDIRVQSSGAIVATSVVADDNVTLIADSGDITLSTVTAGNGGTLTVTATGGGIGNSSSNLTAGDAVLTAGGPDSGIGGSGSANRINTTLSGSLTASAATGVGGIFVSQTGALNIVTVNAAGGDVELFATGAIDEVANDAAVKITGNSVTLNAGGAIGDDADTTNAPLDIAASSLNATTTSAGEVFVIESGALTVLNVTTNSGAVRVQSSGSIGVGAVSASSQDVTLISNTGSITSNSSNVTARNLTMTATAAGQAIGATGAGRINTTLSGWLNSSASDGAGGVYVSETGDLLIKSVNAGGGNVELVSSAAIDEADDNATSKVIGAVTSLIAVGPIGDDSDTTNAPLDIQVTSLTATSSAPGSITLIDAVGLTLTSATTNAGNIRVRSSGGIVATSVIASANVTLIADTGDATVGTVTATSGNASITAAAGGLVNANSAVTAANLSLTAGGADSAIGAAGASNDIDVVLSGTLTANAADGSGGIYVTATSGDLKVGTVNADGGDVDLIVTDGDIVNSTSDITGRNSTLQVDATDKAIGASGSADDINVTLSGWLTALAPDGTGGVYVTESNATSIKSIDADTGNVELISGGGIDEQDDDATLKLNAVDAVLTAAGPIGDDADVTNAPLDIQVATLTATSSANGEIFIRDTGGLTLTNVSTTVGPVRVQSTGTINALSVISNNDATLIADSGAVTIKDVTAGNGGAVTITATAGSLVDNTSNVIAGDAVLTAGGDGSAIGSSASPINLTLSGSLTAAASTGAGDIFISESNDTSVKSIDAGTGDVRLVSAGSIDETDDTATVKIMADDAVLLAGGSIGDDADTTNAPLDIQVTSLTAATSAAGEVYLRDTGGLTLTSVRSHDGNVWVQSTGAITATDVLANSDGGASSTGHVTLIADSGEVSLTDVVANTAGTVTITATDGSIVDATSNVTAGDAVLNALADGDSIGALAAPINVTLSGTLTALASTGTGGIYINETGDLSIASVHAGTGDSVLVATGGIDEAVDDAAVKVTADALTLTAGGPIGDDADVTNAPVDIEVGSLTATTSAAGEIYIRDTGGLTLTSVSSHDGNVRVQSSGALVVTGVLANSDGGASSNGDVTLIADAGNVSLTDVIANSDGTVNVTASAGSIVDNTSAVSGGHGNLTAAGDGNAIGTSADPVNVELSGTLTATASTGTGGIYVTATSGDLNVGTVNAAGGDVELQTVDGSLVDSSSAVTGATTLLMAGGNGKAVGTSSSPINTTLSGPLTTTASTGSGGIFVSETGDLVLADANASTGNIELTATGGIDEAVDDSAVKIVGEELVLTAAGPIGDDTDVDTAPLDIQVSSLTATSSAAGEIFLRDTGGLTLTDVTSHDGDVWLRSTSAITATSVTANHQSPATGRNVTLVADSGDVLVGSITASGTGTTSITATDGNIVDASSLIVATDANLTAGGDGNAIGDGTPINTRLLGTLTANAATGIGEINIRQQTGSFSLGTINAAAGDIDIRNLAGSIFNDSSNVTGDDLRLEAIGVGRSVGSSNPDGDINITLSGTVTALAQTGTGGVFLSETGAMDIVIVDAATGDVELTATGSIDEDADDDAAKIIGADVTLSAAGPIGDDSDLGDAPLDIEVDSLTATTSSAGEIFIRETGGLTLTDVTSHEGEIWVRSTGGIVATNVLVDAGQTDAGNDITLLADTGNVSVGTVNANLFGDVVITASAGSVVDDSSALTARNATLTAGATDGLIGALNVVLSGVLNANAADGDGGVTITATNGDLNIATIDADAGDVVLLVVDGDIRDATSDVIGNNATLVVQGEGHSIGAVGNTTDINVTLAGTLAAFAVEGSGGIFISETGAMSINAVNAGDGNAVLQATGAIDEAVDNSLVKVTAADLTLLAAGPIGDDADITNAPLDIEVTSLTAHASAAGEIDLRDVGGLTLTDVTTTDGDIRVQSTGSITATNVVANSDVTLVADTGEVLLTTVTAADGGTVTATATLGSVLDATSAVTAGDAVFTAGDDGGSVGTNAAPVNVVLSGSLEASAELGVGGVYVTGTDDDLRLARITADDGDVVLVADVGEIVRDSSFVSGKDASLIATADARSIGGGGVANHVQVLLSGSLTARAETGNGGVFVTELGDMLIADVDAGVGNAELNSTASIDEAVDDATVKVTADALVISAVNSIGDDANTTTAPLDVSVNSLTVSSSGNGTVSIRDEGTLGLNGLSVANGDARIEAGGDIAIGTVNGGTNNIEIVSANGSLTDASSDVTARNLTLTADADGQSIGTAGDGDINITLSGALTAIASTGGGGVFVSESNAMLVDRVDAGTGDVVLSAGGSMREASDPTNVTGNRVTLNAQGAIGDDEDLFLSLLDVRANELTAHSTAPGEISIWAAGDVTLTDVDTVDGNIRVFSNGHVTAEDVAGVGDVSLASDRGITAVQVTATQNAQVSAGSGDVLAQTVQAGGDAHVFTQLGDIEARSVVSGGTAIVATGEGSVDAVRVDAGGDANVTARQGQLIARDVESDSDVTLVNLDGDILVSDVSAVNGTVVMTADLGSILDAASSVTAANAVFSVSASRSIGTADAPIGTTLSGTLSATAIGSGDIAIRETGVMLIQVVNAGSGDAYLTAGGLIDEAADSTVVKLTADTAVLIAGGSIGDVATSVDAPLDVDLATLVATANGGGLTIRDVDGEPLEGGVVLADVDVAGDAWVLSTGAVSANSVYAGGDIALTAESDLLRLGTVRSANAGTITVTAEAGSIDGHQSDVVGGDAVLNAVAVGQTIGSASSPIQTTLSGALTATASDGVFVSETGELLIAYVNAGGGDATLRASRAINEATVSNAVNVSGRGVNLIAGGEIGGTRDGDAPGQARVLDVLAEELTTDSSAGNGHQAIRSASDVTVFLANAGSGNINLSGAAYELTGIVRSAVLTMESDASLTGIGRVDGVLRLEAAAEVSPGLSPGSIRTNGLELNAGGIVSIELAGFEPVSGYDQLEVSGVVDLSADGAVGGTLNVIDTLPRHTPRSVFRIIDNDLTDPVVGTFAGLPEGGKVQVGDTQYEITYVGGDGNDVELTIVPPPRPPLIVRGQSSGGSRVQIENGVTGEIIREFDAYRAGTAGGVNVAVADLDRDGVMDVITGAKAVGGPHVRVYSGATGAVLFDRFPFDANFRGGVRVAVGDVNRDGHFEIIAAPGEGLLSDVRVLRFPNGEQVRRFRAYHEGFFGGVFLASADFNGDGHWDIVTGAGPGGGPHVRVFSGKDNSELASFFPYAGTFTGGVQVKAIDLTGDGVDDIVVGRGDDNTRGRFVYDGTTYERIEDIDAAVLAGVKFNEVLVPDNFAPRVITPLQDQVAFTDSPTPFMFSVPANTFWDDNADDVLKNRAMVVGEAPLPDWLSFNPLTSTFAGTPSINDIGRIEVMVTNDDGRDGEVVETFALTVRGSFVVTETDGGTVTSESGATDTFDVVLTERPDSDVVLTVVSNDTGEVAVSPSTLTFTPSNWNVVQTVTVTGQADNEIADGDVEALVTIAVNTNQTDDLFDAMPVRTVRVTNRSHVSSNVFVLPATGRATDYVDVASLTGNADIDVELRTPDGTILSPGIGGRISLAGYPAGSYEVWVNDESGDYAITPSATLGTSTTEPTSPAIDLDGDGQFEFSTDGILLLAYAFGTRGEQLETFRSAGNTRSGAEIEVVIEQLADSLDIDGNGQFSFNSDGVLLLAYAFGQRDGALAAFGDAGAIRSADQVTSRLDGLTLAAAARQQSSDAVAMSVAVHEEQHLLPSLAIIELAQEVTRSREPRSSNPPKRVRQADAQPVAGRQEDAAPDGPEGIGAIDGTTATKLIEFAELDQFWADSIESLLD